MSNKGKKLLCRKCLSHGRKQLLKNHAAVCPFGNCPCPSCTRLMQLRKNAFLRRYKSVMRAEDATISEYRLFDSTTARLRFDSVCSNEITESEEQQNVRFV
ncbi:DM domain-containing protein [Aphelenchoides fujianensis]|nr:DM domain-containing protein [Aphelenchoides fujianensis]